MLYSSKVTISIYICTCALYFTWGFTKLSGLYLIFINPNLYAKQIAVTIAYIVSIFGIDYLVPESLNKYTIVGMYFSFGILPWLALRHTNIRRQNLGELIFISQYLSKTIYVIIPLSLVALWSFNRVWTDFSSQTISSTTYIFESEINSYLLYTCLFTVVLSATIYGYIISWNKLEIRDKGIWFIGETVWEEIVDYSWAQNKQSDILVVKQINGYKKEIKNEYALAPGEKETVDKIFRSKIINKL